MATVEPLLLVIDASLDNRIATELKNRRRASVALSSLDLHRKIDPELLPELSVRMPDGDWVLVTADDAMPGDWADLIDWLRPTIATISPRNSDDYNDDQWGRDVVHRWAHVMQRQERQSIRRYRLKGHGLWKPVRRRRR